MISAIGVTNAFDLLHQKHLYELIMQAFAK
jgi:hypothetical protein